MPRTPGGRRRSSASDVTENAGVGNHGKWAANAAWFDYDKDGRLDLFVCNYARLSFDHPVVCKYRGTPTYCEQKDYPGERSALFHNNGDGTFTDVSHESGILQYPGRALGVVSIDVDDDGWPDLFVARDASPNLLLMNKRNGTFEDVGLDAEVAYSPDGIPKSGMGVDAGDVNGDGRPDFVVTNFNDEYHSLFLSRPSFPFDDATVTSHLAEFTRFDVGWGTHFLDYDNNGILDLVIVNGHINKIINLTRANVTYQEFPLLLRNNGTGVFRDMKPEAGPAFAKRYPARGLAVGDFDNDGDTDIVFSCLNQKPVLLRNNLGHRNNWIGFQLVGEKSNRDAIGARLTLHTGNGTAVRWITGGASCLASHDHRVRFGLGSRNPGNLPTLEIKWPSSIVQSVSNLQINRYHTITESAGAKS